MNELTNILSLKNCDIGYRSGKNSTILLEDISLDLDTSNLIALIGLNGSGKSSLLKTIVNLLGSLKGEINISGRNINEYSIGEIARLIGYVKANWQPEENMTVEELIRLGRYPFTNLFGQLDESDMEIVEQSIYKLSLVELRNRPLAQISDGERQRAMLARVFAQQTKIVVLDEPTAFLDVQHKYEIISRLRMLCDNGITVIFSTHDIQLASYFADRFWLIQNKNILDGAPEDIFLNGSMARLFSSSDVDFDDEIGNFIPKLSSDKSITLVYDEKLGLVAKWTKKALFRKGFSIQEKLSDDPYINIVQETHKLVWNLHLGNRTIQCYSILDLLNEL
ncbi:MAG: ABC transporter ATP-binding protein [Bacteroidales bacterium]|nr:ABC transporter ATP-binding protein [Bacteroidales bacterium]